MKPIYSVVLALKEKHMDIWYEYTHTNIGGDRKEDDENISEYG